MATAVVADGHALVLGEGFEVLQDLVDREFGAAAGQASAAMASDEDGIEAKLRSQGLIFNRPVLEPFRQVVRSAGLYAQWRDQYGSEAWKTLTKTTGELT